MRVLSLAAACAALVASARAANIDTDGFTTNGATTYCQGVNGGSSGGAMSFPNLYTNSLNRCPILVTLTPTQTTVRQKTVLDISWKATAKFGEIPGNIFPNAINQATRTPQSVQSSFIKACKSGTNCGTVIDGTPVGANPDTGAFDASGVKNLKSYQFNFADVGDYIVIGKVTLPGDASLNVSATEFLAFQKITVVDVNTPISPSPSPTVAPTPSASNSTTPSPANGSKDGSDEDGVGTVTPSKETTSAPTTSDEIPNEGSTDVSTGSSEDKGFFASHGVLLAVVAGACIVVFMLGYVLAMRRKKQNVTTTKLDRSNNRTFMSHSDHQPMEDPEPMPYIRKKSARSNDQNSVPIMSRPSIDSVDHIMDLSKRGSEMEPSFDEDTPSFDEGTVTASNKAVSTMQRRTQDDHASSEVTTDSTKMMLASLYKDDRDTALYQAKTAKKPVRASEDATGFYQSEQWNPAETARPYDDREQSTISFAEEGVDSDSRRGFGAPSFMSEGDFDNEERHTRYNSEASVDSYAFRPSNVSVADSYKSRVSRYSIDDEMDRESSRISGISLYSERDTDV